MPRQSDYDRGLSGYRDQHGHGGQHTRHIIGNAMCQHYGVSSQGYAGGLASTNYRMGGVAVNARDTRVDNQLVREAFGLNARGGYSSGYGYDAGGLARQGISQQQQLDRVGAQFDRAGEAFAATGDRAFLAMQADLRGVAGTHLDADLREFRMRR